MGGATRYLFPFLHSTAEVVTGFFIIIFLSIYIAVDPDMYRRGIMHLFPHARRQRAGEILSAIAAVLRRWMVTQLIAMCTIGAVTTVLLLILHVKAAFALGLLAGLFEFIPTVGPILSAIPAIGMAFLDSPEKALSVAIAFWGIQFMENHLLIPLLMKANGLPPALTILSQRSWRSCSVSSDAGAGARGDDGRGEDALRRRRRRRRAAGCRRLDIAYAAEE
jgi:predicted PurR-regulated permease PerM